MLLETVRSLMSFWPIGLPITLILLLPIICFLEFCIGKLIIIHKRAKEKRLIRIKQIIADNSALCQSVKELNNQTNYYTEILDNGCSEYTVYVDSLTKYRRVTPEMGLQEFLELNETNVLRALEQVRRNRVIFEVYEKHFDELLSTASAEEAEELGISFSKYLYLERVITQEEKLDIICDYSVICTVSYTSPAGVNSYSKDAQFSNEEIIETLNTIRRQHTYFQSEEFRRKTERAKVTPALRYDVMRRDGFCCRLCGRSAKDGVKLEVDHIVPVSKGGNTTYNNLQTLCWDCNRGKGDKLF